MSSKKILITGGTGFAGSHLVELLQSEPEYEIHVTHIAPIPDQLKQIFNSRVQYHPVDLTMQAEVEQLFSQLKPDEIYQLASVAVVGESHLTTRKVLELNQSIVISVLEAMRQHVPKSSMLVVSSSEVYGKSSPDQLPMSENHPLQPVNPYGVSKVTQDLLAHVYVENFGLRIVTARPFNHIGERQESGFVVSDFAKQIVAIERGHASSLKVGNLEARRDFTDVKDTVKAYQVLMERGEAGEAYNIGSGRSISMGELVEALRKLSSGKILIEADSTKLRPADIPIMQADCQKIFALGWQPKSTIELALARVLDYWRNLS